jgi:hypothetical protein
VISIFSFSKVYAMTGWRVGYAVARGDVPQLMRSTQEPQVSCPSTISQKAAEAALAGPREPVDAMRDAYAQRAALAVKVADSVGLRAYAPEGTIYMLLDVSAGGSDGGLDFALDLLRDQRGVGRTRQRLRPRAAPVWFASLWRRRGTRSKSVSNGSLRSCSGEVGDVVFDGIEERLDTEAKRRVAAYIAERADEIFEFTCELIRTPSVNPPGDEGSGQPCDHGPPGRARGR